LIHLSVEKNGKEKKRKKDPQKAEPVLTALIHIQKTIIKAKIETPSLSYEPATDLEIYPGAIPVLFYFLFEILNNNNFVFF